MMTAPTTAKVGKVEHALRGIRELLRVDIGIRVDESRFDVSSLCHELPESEIEDCIGAAIVAGTRQIPQRKDLEAALLNKGKDLASLHLDEKRKGYKPRYDVREKNCTAKRVIVSDQGEELSLRFSLLAQGESHMMNQKEQIPTPENSNMDSASKSFAVFELLAELDNLQTLAQLVVDLLQMISVEEEHDEACIFESKFEAFRHLPLYELPLKLGDRILLRQGQNLYTLILSDLYLIARFRPRKIPPSLVFLHSDSLKNRTNSCEVCRAYSARTMVSNDPRFPKSHMLFCDQCLHMFYYTVEGRLHPSTEKLIDPTQTNLPIKFNVLY